MMRRWSDWLYAMPLLCLSAAVPAQQANLEPLIEVSPAYPPAALQRAQEGRVEVELTVGAQGVVQNARVVSATPENVFDAAALEAVRRWRYPAEDGREPVTLTEQIEFRLPSSAAAPRAPERIESRTANRNGLRSECIREGASFNYGDRVEVSLINVCETWVLVYGCAQGTGRDLGRWVCSHASNSVLAPSGSPRIGESVLLEGSGEIATATVTDRLQLSRAPNSEYWWVACEPGDTQCRAAASQWARALDRQDASADPQGRSRLTLARSY